MNTGHLTSDTIVYSTPGNRAPDGMVAGFLQVTDSLQLRYARWGAGAGKFRGTIVVLQGRNECIEKYFETVDDLQTRGFGVVCFDWRGQGGSTRLLRDAKKGHVEDFSHYLADLEKVLTEIAFPDCKPPFYILAHSMGGLVALLAAPALKNRIRRMVLSAPLLALNNLPFRQSMLQRIAGIATFFGLGRRYISGQEDRNQQSFSANKLTGDKARFDRNNAIIAAHKDLALGAPTVAWLFAACQTMARVSAPGFCDMISVPTLIVTGGADPVISPSAAEHFGRRMRSASFLTIDGARHELLHEKDAYRDQLFAAFDAFVPGSDSV